MPLCFFRYIFDLGFRAENLDQLSPQIGSFLEILVQKEISHPTSKPLIVKSRLCDIARDFGRVHDTLTAENVW